MIDSKDCLTKCSNYEGLKYDLESLLEMIIARINGERSLEGAAEFIRLNYPKHYRKIKKELNYKIVPKDPTPKMIYEAAQRLAFFEDGSAWPDSWSNRDVIQMKIQAERVLRSGINSF